MKRVRYFFTMSLICALGLLFQNCGPAGNILGGGSGFGGEPYPGGARFARFVVQNERCANNDYAFEIHETEPSPGNIQFAQVKEQCAMTTRIIEIKPEDWIIDHKKFLFEGRVYDLTSINL